MRGEHHVIQAASAFAPGLIPLCRLVLWSLSGLRALGKLPGHTLDVTDYLWLMVAFLLPGKSRFWIGNLQKAL